MGGQIRRWEKARTQPQLLADAAATDPRLRLGRWIAAQLAQRGVSLRRVRTDLAVADRSLEEHIADKITWAGAGLLLPLAVWVIFASVGAAPPLTFTAAAALVAAIVFSFNADLRVAQLARERRADLRRALACYLDLLAMSMAGGRGLPEALPTAARIGDGWAFGVLQSTIDHAQLVNDTPWKAFADLGEAYGISEMEDLGGALALVANDGAKVRTSLISRAATQRRRQLAEAESAVDRANQSIQFASIVLAVGFLVFLMYPAVVTVLST